MPAIYLASDALGADLRLKLLAHLQDKHPGYEVRDLGNFDKYYEGAYKVHRVHSPFWNSLPPPQ